MSFGSCAGFVPEKENNLFPFLCMAINFMMGFCLSGKQVSCKGAILLHEPISQVWGTETSKYNDADDDDEKVVELNLSLWTRDDGSEDITGHCITLIAQLVTNMKDSIFFDDEIQLRLLPFQP